MQKYGPAGEWIYQTWASSDGSQQQQQQQQQQHEATAGDAWVELHTDSEFQNFVCWLRGELDREAEAANEHTRRRLAEIFAKRLEEAHGRLGKPSLVACFKERSLTRKLARASPREHTISEVFDCPNCKISPKKQLEASKQQQRDFCHHLLRASAQVTLYTILLGVDGVIYAPTHFRAF
eukprot:1159056-Pelagomonas_calceolata.AAC.3